MNRNSLKMLAAALVILFGSINAKAQQKITLSDCYGWAEQNYPLINQKKLISLSEQYSISNLEKGLLPQITFNAQSTYQSEVVSFNAPGFNFKPLPKDQYKMYAEVNQPLTELHTVKTQKELQQAQSSVQQQNLNAELYKIRDRVNQLYFGILLTDEQIKINELNKKDFEIVIDKVTAAINNGVDYKSSLDKIKAELIRNDQRSIELQSQRKAFTDMLSFFISKPIDNNVVFTKPDVPKYSETIERPELKAFDLKNKTYSIQEKLIRYKNIPHFSVFMQGGAGKPSPLNFIDNTFKPYFIGGLRMNWNFSNLYTRKNEKLMIDVDRKYNDMQKDLFIFNTNLMIKQQNNEITKLNQLVKTDDNLVALRASIKTTSQVQLENGVISSSDYIKEANAEDQARQNKALHEMQLLQAQYNIQFTTGIDK